MTPTETIDISRIHFPVTKLGPGRRVGIWVQGCSIRCMGCVSVDTWARNRSSTSVRNVLSAIEPWAQEADGFTISGGEPFDQAVALTELLAGIRQMSEADILVYTGYSREAVETHLSTMEGLIDALIADPFDENAPHTVALRGSDNQRLSMFTALGRMRFAAYDRPITNADRSFDIMFDGHGEVWLAGIPGRDDFRRLQSILRMNGAESTVSQDKRSVLNSDERPR